ncbi:hypothetical protein MNB_SV-4-1315 [hydrothermal vent metagenome]|uniref:Uncharacterized protein n=1 Tax=hydrothermal vent metagenome TaxID=652676 RepID=A0A1W1E979_9ZZZZ
MGEAMPYLALTGIGMAFVLFVLWSLCRSKLKETTAALEEKEEKVTWFRQVMAQNEQAKTKHEHEMEKRVLELTHTIETLEKKLKEGTKNQVVAKIEAQQQKRENALARAGFTKQEG